MLLCIQADPLVKPERYIQETLPNGHSRTSFQDTKTLNSKMDTSCIPKDVDDAKTQCPHITQEVAASFLEVEATPEQWKAADFKAKENIDIQLENYKYVHKAEIMEGIKVMVIGATGSGKSATANTLIGHNWFEEAYSADSEASVTSVTSEPCAKVFPIDSNIIKANLVVCDTPGSWESQTRSPGLDGVDCYIIVINLATPRFDQETLTKIRSLKGIDGALIVESGRFMVALSHADSVLEGSSLSQYLDKITGDPLHTFLTKVAQGRVVANNNAAETEYQRERQQMALFTLLAQVYNQVQVCNQPKKERTSSFKEGFTNVMASAKRLGGLAVGEVLVKARGRLASTSESSVETVHPPPTQDGDTKAKDARSWSTSDSSVKTSQPSAQDVEVKGKDEPPAPQQQQQQQQQRQQQQGQQEKQESAGDQHQPTGPSSTGSGDNQEPTEEEDAISDKNEEQEKGDLDE